jgi:hypothetical protein
MFSKKFLKKVFPIIHDEFGSTYHVNELRAGSDVYEDYYGFIADAFSLEGESDKVDFIYASYYLNLKEYGDNIVSLNEGDVLIPDLIKFEGKRTYYATVQFTESYSMETYLPSIIEFAINEYQIDEDKVGTDILDTWDYDVTIKEL